MINGYPLIQFPINLILALIPCWIVYYLGRRIHGSWFEISFGYRVMFLFWFVIWFFFFPNTAYLFTEVRHLLGQCVGYDYLKVCAEESWMTLFFFGYALIGVPAFLYGLKKMTQVFSRLFGPFLAWLFPIFMIPLTALGVLLGLVERFDSWNVIENFWGIFEIATTYATVSYKLMNWLVFTVVLYAIYYLLMPILKNVSDD